MVQEAGLARRKKQVPEPRTVPAQLACMPLCRAVSGLCNSGMMNYFSISELKHTHLEEQNPTRGGVLSGSHRHF